MADVTVTLHDREREVALAVGDTVAVLLPENPTTGYQWSIERSSDLLDVIDSVFETGARPRMPGAGGTRRIRLRARKAGIGAVTLAYGRPWEADAAPSRRCVLRAVIHQRDSRRR